MGFIDKYVSTLTSANLQDDARHHTTDALCAAALANTTGAGLGALLSRVKYSDGSVSKTFESGTANLAQLLRIWKLAVRQKGTERRWVKMTAAWDITAAHALFERVAERSLAHWRHWPGAGPPGVPVLPRLAPRGTGRRWLRARENPGYGQRVGGVIASA